jgi:hypothetical protein
MTYAIPNSSSAGATATAKSRLEQWIRLRAAQRAPRGNQRPDVWPRRIVTRRGGVRSVPMPTSGATERSSSTASGSGSQGRLSGDRKSRGAFGDTLGVPKKDDPTVWRVDGALQPLSAPVLDCTRER